MKRSFLEDLGLDKEIIDKILDENSADIGKAKGELEKVRKTLGDRDAQLESLRKSAGDNAELQKKIADLQKENQQKDAEMQAEILKIRRNGMDELLLLEAGAKNLKAAKALLEELDESDDEKYKTAREEQIKALSEAEDTKFLFGLKSIKGAVPGEPGGGPDDTPDFTKMTYDQLTEYLSANPDAKLV